MPPKTKPAQKAQPRGYALYIIAAVVIAASSVAWVMSSNGRQQQAVTKTAPAEETEHTKEPRPVSPHDTPAPIDDCASLEHDAQVLYRERQYDAAVEKLIICSNSDPSSHVKLWNVGVMLSRIGMA